MKIVITGEFPEAAKALIRASFPDDWDLCILLPEEAEGELADADVLIPEHLAVDAALLEKAPRLKLVQTGAGYDNVDLEACTRRGVQVCNAAGINADAVAEHVMAFILCWYKNLLYLDGFMKAGRSSAARPGPGPPDAPHRRTARRGQVPQKALCVLREQHLSFAAKRAAGVPVEYAVIKS